jgi:antitoxin (DNA-binding transcriptional repressor) of toxin-antitoxin stability system
VVAIEVIKVYYFGVEFVPIKDLKSNLAHWTEKASKGEVIQVTKFNRPYVRIVPEGDVRLHRGRNVGKRDLAPALKIGDKLPWFEFLQEDRDET